MNTFTSERTIESFIFKVNINNTFKYNHIFHEGTMRRRAPDG